MCKLYLSDISGRHGAVVRTSAHTGNISADFDAVVQSCGHYVFEPLQTLGNAAANILLAKPFGSGPKNGNFFYVMLHLKTTNHDKQNASCVG